MNATTANDSITIRRFGTDAARTPPTAEGFCITVNWVDSGGNYRPFWAGVAKDGKFIGKTGACKTQEAAIAAARRIVEKH